MAVTSRKRRQRRSARFRQEVLGRPRGVIQPRVRAVGPERFGIVAVDCAKARSKWMLADFYGTVRIPPAVVEHTRAAFDLAVLRLREAVEQHGIEDLIACVEMTGTYHKPVQRAFRRAGLETRLVHPFASSHFRQAEHGDLKTDDHDLAGIFRAAVNGFGLIEADAPLLYRKLQILCRHRRDLVDKKAKLQCQIRHHLDRCLHGFAELFPGDQFWNQAVPLPLLERIAQRGGTPAVVREAGAKTLDAWLRAARVRPLQRTLDKIVAWAGNAAEPDDAAPTLAGVWKTLLDDRQTKVARIRALEQDVAGLLAQTPYLLLLSHPGINVVSAAELAGEMGPIENYASPKAITGRAGLFPSRYQSDGTDRGGNLSRFRNARLRAAWMRIADNMVKCNVWWRQKAADWKEQGVAPRDIRVRIANKMSRAVFQMVSGRKLFHHPSQLDRGYVMEKLFKFQQERQTPPDAILRNLKQAADQIPASGRQEEAAPLVAEYERKKRRRKKGPEPIGPLMAAVLARWGILLEDADEGSVEST